MNERIKELSKQAWDYVQVCDERYSKTCTQLFDEKFAELIIRECAVIANLTLDPLDDYLIGNDILKHFGVKDE